MGPLGRGGRAVSRVELFTEQGAGSIPGVAGPPRPAKVDREPPTRVLPCPLPGEFEA